MITAVAGAVETPALLQVGLAEVDITPPLGFPMAGYYHERLAEGTIDPLKAKAIVFRDGDTAAALVACDLIGVMNDPSWDRARPSEFPSEATLLGCGRPPIGN
jgi:hypothetical protein